MRTAGYATGASVSNPYAYYLAESLANEYDSLPEPPPYRRGALKDLWDATEPLHQRSPAGSRAQEFADTGIRVGLCTRSFGELEPAALRGMQSGYPAAGSFEQAREVLAKLPEGFFLWVHVMAPHLPYLPDATDRGRFLASDNEHGTEARPAEMVAALHPGPAEPCVDKARLRYDEFVARRDARFWGFHFGSRKRRKIAGYGGHRVCRSRRKLRRWRLYPSQPLSDEACDPCSVHRPHTEPARRAARRRDGGPDGGRAHDSRFRRQSKPEWIRAESLWVG